MKNLIKKEKKGFSIIESAGIIMVFIMLILLCNTGITPAQEQAIKNLKETGKAFATVAKQASPAVVFIKVEKTVSAQGPGPQLPFNDDLFRRFFGEPFPGPRQNIPRQKRMVTGQGSGFIISEDGYILTNNHVVGEADKVLVKLLDGREFTAVIVGTDPPTDVAVIKIDAANLPVLPMGDSDALEVGEWVLAVGNPFGLSHTLTAGIVSALGRSSIGITDYEDFIQTDAAINPGNSGGPMINLEGRVVGINTAIFSRSGGYMGIGFAIPVNMAKGIYEQLVEHGSVIRGFLGITIQDITPDLAKSFDLKDNKGIIISEVMPDTPAEEAGLKQGDVIMELSGEPVEQVASFRNEVALITPDTRIKMKILRDGRKKTVTVQVGKKPSRETASTAQPEGMEKLGLTLKTLTRDTAGQYGLQGEKGVLITSVAPGSIADSAGIKAGSIIQEVNRKPVNSVGEFEKALDKSANKHVLLLIKDDRGTRFIALKTE